MKTELTIQKTFDEFEELCADYALPNSIVDIGNMYFYAGKFEELLKASMQREAKMREALTGLLADISEYQTINNLGGENNHWQVRAREALSSEYRDNEK